MRVGEGEVCGRNMYLYHPELFWEHEEVIVFTREEFNRTYISMREQIDYINKKQALLEMGDEWKLLGYWPQILEKVHLLDVNIDSIFKEEPFQCYLDAYLFDAMGSLEKKTVISRKDASTKTKIQI